MGMFKWAEEESKGSPLFAAALGLGALTSKAKTDLITSKLLIPSINKLDHTIVDAAGELNADQVKALKSQMIDKSIKDKLLVIPDKRGASFQTAPKKYLPRRKELETLIRAGGLQTFEGKADPIKAIQAIRESGGLIKLPTSGANAVTLAHELGHATALNPGPSLRKAFPYKFLDSMGRQLVNSGSRGALASALLAGSFSSDDNKKWLVPGGIALTQAPLLAEEATASLKGMEALRALKNTPSNTLTIGNEASKLFAPAILENAGKSLRRAWGTYGLGAAGLLAAPILAIRAREQWDTRKRD